MTRQRQLDLIAAVMLSIVILAAIVGCATPAPSPPPSVTPGLFGRPPVEALRDHLPLQILRGDVMHLRLLLAIVLLPLVLTGCSMSAPISATLTTGGDSKLSGRLESGLQDAHFNLQNAITVGALPADDPGYKCLDETLRSLGLVGDQAPPPSFVPKVDSLLGKGSVLYIRAQQLKRLTGAGIQTPASCEQFIGMIVVDVARDGAGAFPGGGLIPKLR